MPYIRILFSLPLLAAVVFAADDQPSERQKKLLDIPAFVQQLETLRQTTQIPGLSFAVLQNQTVVIASGLGHADDLQQGLPATADTLYNIASVTKPIAAVVALRLVEQGSLQLDQPMSNYSEWDDFCAAFSQQPSIFAQDLKCEIPGHTLRHLLSHTATGSPGTRFSYNPVLYSWASRPIMAVVDEPFSSLVDRYVFAPAGMHRSARQHRDLAVPEELAKQLAPPHRLTAEGVIERAPKPSAQGDGAAGGVISSVLDLARFDVALDQGRLISAASRATMLTPTTANNGDTLPYAIGWYVEEYQGHKLVWHSGWWEDAYSALYIKIPARRLTFIILANSEGIWWGNPLDQAAVHKSDFAQAFFQAFLLD